MHRPPRDSRPGPTAPLPALALALLAALLLAVPAAAGTHGESGAEGAAGLPDLPDRRLTAGFLVVDGVYNSELMAPYDVLQHTVFHTGSADRGIETFVVSPDGKPVTTFEGIELVPHHSFETAPPIDVLVVPSAEGSMAADLEDRRMIDWVRRAGERALFVMSLCDGAFVLAEAGLLDGLAATTFPSDYDALTERFPEIDLKINVSFVHDGKALTSQGGARSYDVAMYLVDLLYGPQVAAGVGRGLLIPWPPEPERVPNMVIDPLLHRELDPDTAANEEVAAEPPGEAPEAAPVAPAEDDEEIPPPVGPHRR